MVPSKHKLNNRFVLSLLAFEAGLLLIALQIILYLIFFYSIRYNVPVASDSLLDSDEKLFLSLILSIGLISSITFPLCIVKRSSYSHRRTPFFIGLGCFVLYFLSTLVSLSSLLFGGGWYIGAFLSNVGSISLYFLKPVSQKDNQDLWSPPKLRTFREFKITRTFLLALCFSFPISLIVPLAIEYNAIPDPLIESYPNTASIPSTYSPNYTNTFYIMPIWEWKGDDYEYGIRQLYYLKALVGGDSYTGRGYVRIGRSFSCWYTADLYENGSYNPYWLIHQLNMSAITNTPVLIHMNGGNWGQAHSTHPVIQAMRENISNCQWDQYNWCPDIRFQPGPNDRYWNLCPDTDWEHFRERNIKQALSVIYDWWQEHPDLLVGFSTDSEIHLEDKGFEDMHEDGYRSYFDYNPLSIKQFKEWAQANWTLDEFNALCETDFASWDDVDAPRDPSIVGHAGNPWWETWTEFRIWQVKEAALRQARWIFEAGFPRDMIWNHQILSEPGDYSARYIRADPIETAINPYCKLGVTRYGWISPSIWHSLGEIALEETNDSIPSWGIFEWNLWTQHDYWAYTQMLASIYEYGGHVICPNEWINCSINEGLWIPGEPCNKSTPYEINGTVYGSDETGCAGTPGSCCCVSYDENGTCLRCIDPHGNPQFIAALQDFVKIAQDYPRGTCPSFRIDRLSLSFYNLYYTTYKTFEKGTGLLIIGIIWGLEFLSPLLRYSRSQFLKFFSDRKRKE